MNTSDRQQCPHPKYCGMTTMGCTNQCGGTARGAEPEKHDYAAPARAGNRAERRAAQATKKEPRAHRRRR